MEFKTSRQLFSHGWPECDGRDIRRTVLRHAAGLLILTQALGLFLVFHLIPQRLTAEPSVFDHWFAITHYTPSFYLLAALGAVLVLTGRPATGAVLALLSTVLTLNAGGLFLSAGTALALLIAAIAHANFLFWCGTGCMLVGSSMLWLPLRLAPLNQPFQHSLAYVTDAGWLAVWSAESIFFVGLIGLGLLMIGIGFMLRVGQVQLKF